IKDYEIYIEGEWWKIRFVDPCVILSPPKAGEESSKINLLTLDPCLRQAGFIRLWRIQDDKTHFPPLPEDILFDDWFDANGILKIPSEYELAE
ncbi:hypothetical protein KKA47_01170, partial [bacterium]|nr:hypothetical protein [bacterium]